MNKDEVPPRKVGLCEEPRGVGDTHDPQPETWGLLYSSRSNN